MYATVSLPILVILLMAPLFGQTAKLEGRVMDESGAVVPGAVVRLQRINESEKAVTAKSNGSYSIANLAPGKYSVVASAPHLEMATPTEVTLRLGPNILDLRLSVAVVKQRVTVEENASPGVSVEAASNASATIISGADLASVSDDPQDLADDLQALAGPSAGPSGGAMFVDGFSGGQLPPKESIREIRLNSNPFSPEYDKLGLGRIEIFTKPGGDKFHGSIGYNLGTDVWNTRNPYSSRKVPFLLQESENSFSGPLSKRSSFTLDLERQAVDNGSVTNAVTLNGPFSSVLTSPQRHWLVGPHVDYQLNDHNTLAFRYLWTRADVRDAGIGNFDLISRGYHLLNVFQTVQAIDTAVFGTTVNETRFQYFRHSTQTDSNTLAPEIQVLGSFNGGGALITHGLDTQSNFELQNYTTMLRGTHAWRFGVRIRGQLIDSLSPLNFNGTFTFAGGLAPELNNANQPILDSGGQPMFIQIASIEVYRRTLLFQQQGDTPAQIRALGGGASQFTVNAGMPNLSVHQADGGLFVGDDWRIGPNLTVNLGLRYELQTNTRDRRDIAPRAALAWAPGSNSKARKTVIRVGFGMFYDRFALTNVLAADRYNGTVQKQYVVTNPDFYPAAPSISSLGVNPNNQAIQEIDSHLRSPYIMQSAFTLERQLPKKTTLAATYTNSRALHVLRSADINAPLPRSRAYPYPGQGPIFLMTASGVYNQNQLIVNVNSKMNAAASLFGYYVLNHALSNSDGLSTFPANPYNYSGEYGPAATDVRHRVVVGGTILTRWNIRFNPFVTIQSGPPFNITTGNDPYGVTLFTARPGLSTDNSKAGLIQTPYGLLDPNPGPNEKLISRNYGRGPGQYYLNLRVGRTWGFGSERGSMVRSARDGQPTAGPLLGVPQGGRGLFGSPNTSHRYNMTLSMSVRNLLNHTNPGPIIGNVSSPLFGRSNQIAGSVNGEGFSELANNRRLELQMRFTF